MEKTQEGLLLHRAYSFAALAHEGQKRKGGPVPYIAHPAEVAQILAQAGATAEVICAGLLHDTLEDTSVTPEQLEEAFGLVVRKLVEGCSEDKTLFWEERKKHTIQMLKSEISMDVKLITCADKLSNLRSIYLDYRELGDALWSRFHRGKKSSAGITGHWGRPWRLWRAIGDWYGNTGSFSKKFFLKNKKWDNLLGCPTFYIYR